MEAISIGGASLGFGDTRNPDSQINFPDFTPNSISGASGLNEYLTTYEFQSMQTSSVNEFSYLDEGSSSSNSYSSSSESELDSAFDDMGKLQAIYGEYEDKIDNIQLVGQVEAPFETSMFLNNSGEAELKDLIEKYAELVS